MIKAYFQTSVVESAFQYIKKVRRILYGILDEQIIELRRKEKAASEDIRGDGVTINGELLTFKETLLSGLQAVWLWLCLALLPGQNQPADINIDMSGPKTGAAHIRKRMRF